MPRQFKFRLVYRRKEDGHIWILMVDPFAEGDGRRQMLSMEGNDLWELIAKDQYTGLKDKNGVEIYEGDICQFDNGDKFFINCEEWMQLFPHWIGDPEREDQIRDFYRIEKSEVIGNIYEHKELLHD